MKTRSGILVSQRNGLNRHKLWRKLGSTSKKTSSENGTQTAESNKIPFVAEASIAAGFQGLTDILFNTQTADVKLAYNGLSFL